VRAFVTGGTGFLGGRLVARLRGRGDDVVALVRSPQQAGALRELGCELVPGDLSDRETLAEAMDGCDSVFHLAAIYKVGIPASERPRMYEVNVRGTENVLDAARDAGAGRIVYVSTVNAFGNTRSRVVDETYERPVGDYVSYYDETKHLAHEAAKRRIEQRYPIVVVQPGVVYGPGDHSEIGAELARAAAGKLLFLSFPDLGFNAAFVDDVADGILLAHDKGRDGQAYVLGGKLTTLDELVTKGAHAAGRKPPRLTLPTALMWPLVPLGPIIGRLLGISPNLSELISASHGVTYWATDEKARRELGYAPRTLEEGLRLTVGAGH
jgi:dihydroflavonol-4-reductase